MLRNGRTGIIVWLHHTKYVKALRKFGNIYYVSKKMRYAVLYVDTDESEGVIKRIKKQRYTKDVALSHIQEIRTSFSKKKDTEKAREEEMVY